MSKCECKNREPMFFHEGVTITEFCVDCGLVYSSAEGWRALRVAQKEQRKRDNLPWFERVFALRP